MRILLHFSLFSDVNLIIITPILKIRFFSNPEYLQESKSDLEIRFLWLTEIDCDYLSSLTMALYNDKIMNDTGNHEAIMS